MDSEKRVPESCTEIINRLFVQVKNGDKKKMRRKSYVIPSYVASFFFLNLSYVFKKNYFWTRDTSYLYDKY